MNRSAGLHHLELFLPRAGLDYATQRNFDFGTGKHAHVSCLSSWISRRLVCEVEILETIIRVHGREKAEKFIQEVFWRGYFKGWLERRPDVWRNYCIDRDELSEKYEVEIQTSHITNTNVHIFNEWAKELFETGYLHNHARMWFASIWIFTLKLPWQLGADLFLRYLKDGDPASNTLSWRWVAGLHTVGKNYAATVPNIEKFAGHRFGGVTDVLTQNPDPITEPFPVQSPQDLEPNIEFSENKKYCLLLTEADCTPDWCLPVRTRPIEIATLNLARLRSPHDVSDTIIQAERHALEDTVQRLGLSAYQLDHPQPGAISEWVRTTGADTILTPYVPQGWVRDYLQNERPFLDAIGVDIVMPRRKYDDLVWQHSTAGFFKVKKQIPNILKSLDIMS